MIVMKRFGLLVLAAALWASSALAVPPGVHSVYILPMGGGLDQYLAEWLTREHVVDVVTDPKAADAVLTDSIGEAFELKMATISPRDDDEKPNPDAHSFRPSHGRGTLFLVDAKSRTVIWSDYEKVVTGSANAGLDRQAQRVAKKLQAAGTPKSK